jgi:hypothetical protein
MKNIIKITLILLFLSFKSFSQKNLNVDYEHIFKNWIYLEKPSGFVKDSNSLKSITVKNDSIYRIFMTNLQLKLSDVSSNLPKKFVVKCLELNGKSIIYTDENLTAYNVGIHGFSYTSQCDGKMILVFDSETGMSYRVAGFNGNDLLGLITNLKDYNYKEEDKDLKSKSIIKKYFIKDVDLLCIYKGLTCEDSDNYIKYPCLKSCLGYIITE